ncbi:hypothetical protein Q8A67_006332 [Cirrhinus molitorella]|uniref:Uncharacterized protein n=1 Tax=Cirrhinus molitorella TaxID=172907 RepID=A0AA88Q030_9TELE|nr:hypothetical protein Q8A67_006332 [Cirrhinus molitorella]
MSQKPLVDFAISDDSDEDTVPPSRILTRESPWVQWPSEKIVATLLDFGIPVSSDLTHDDLILLASNALVSLPASSSDASEAIMAPPAQPIQTGRKRSAKSSSPLQHKKPRNSPPPSLDSASANAQLSKAILQLTETVKGFETHLGFYKSAFASCAPGPSIPSTSFASVSVSPSVLDPISSAAPSTSSATSTFAPAQTPLQNAATSLPTAAFNLSTALTAQVFGRPFVPPAAASVSPKMRSNIISGKSLSGETMEERVLSSDHRQEDKNGHSFIKLDEDIVKRSCDKAVFKYSKPLVAETARRTQRSDLVPLPDQLPLGQSSLNFCLRLAGHPAALQLSTSLAAVGWFFPLGIP